MQGIGIFKAFLTEPERTKESGEGSICGLRRLKGWRASCEESLTGSFFSDRASLSLHGGVWAGALGTGGVAARELNRNPMRDEAVCKTASRRAGAFVWWGTGR